MADLRKVHPKEKPKTAPKPVFYDKDRSRSPNLKLSKPKELHQDITPTKQGDDQTDALRSTDVQRNHRTPLVTKQQNIDRDDGPVTETTPVSSPDAIYGNIDYTHIPQNRTNHDKMNDHNFETPSDTNMEQSRGKAKPKPTPRMSILKKQSTEEKDGDLSRSDNVGAYGEGRSESTVSTDSSRSLSRTFSYQAAVDDFIDEVVEEEEKAEGKSDEDPAKSVTDETVDSGDSVQHSNVPQSQSVEDINVKPSETRNIPVKQDAKSNNDSDIQSIKSKTPHRKAPPPPLPTKGPVGHLPLSNTQSPMGSSRESSPLGSRLRVDLELNRTSSPPRTPPKPSKQLIEHAKHVQLETLIAEGSKGLSNKMPMSVSTPNISRHQEGPKDTVNLRSNKSKHHQSTVDVGEKRGPMPQTSTSGLQNLVRALSKIGSESKDESKDREVTDDKKRRNSSLFYFNLEGEENDVLSKKENRRSWSFGAGAKKPKEKKDKQKSDSNSVFYCGVNEGGTLKFDGTYSVIGVKKETDSGKNSDDGTLKQNVTKERRKSHGNKSGQNSDDGTLRPIQTKEKRKSHENKSGQNSDDGTLRPIQTKEKRKSHENKSGQNSDDGTLKPNAKKEKRKSHGNKMNVDENEGGTIKAFNPKDVLAQYVSKQYKEKKRALKLPTLPPKTAAPKSFDEVLPPVKLENAGSGTDGSLSPVAPPRNKRKSRQSKHGNTETSMNTSDSNQETMDAEYAEIGDVEISDDEARKLAVSAPDLPPRPVDLIRASQIQVDSGNEGGEEDNSIYEVPPDPDQEILPDCADPEGEDDFYDSFDSFDDDPENYVQDPGYVNNDRTRRQISHEEGTKFEKAVRKTPTIVIRSSSDDNQLKDENDADNHVLKKMPSLEELETIYMPMSPSMPALLQHSDSMPTPTSKRFSDSSISSGDYTPMTPQTLDLLGINLRRDISHGLRPSSWAGPETEEGKTMDLIGQSQGTDSDDSVESEGEFNLADILTSIKDMKDKLDKRKTKLFYAAKEMMTTEETFVGVLKLINEDFRNHVTSAKGPLGGPVIPIREIDQIFKYLPLLQHFSEELLQDLKIRIENWGEHQRIADVFVKKGPFLKMYTDYIREYETICEALDESRKRFPDFDKAATEFENSPKCSNMALKHFMLKPIQRIPQYKLLLKEYKKYLNEESEDYKDTEAALDIVSGVAEHANRSMAFGDNLKKLVEIQNNLMGEFEVVKPGRLLVKSGVLQKICRKETQPRMFFLFNDILLCTTPLSNGYRYKSELPLDGMKVSKPGKEDFANELSIISTTKSFRLSASTPEEREEWLEILQTTIKEYRMKKYSYMLEANKKTGGKPSPDRLFQSDTEMKLALGQQAPAWVPDSRVSMCVKCHEEFTITFRRHHCRACGKVFCGPCSDNRAPLRYQNYKPGRVCMECYNYLKKENENLRKSLERSSQNKEAVHAVKQVARGFVNGSAQSQGTLWGSFGKGRRKRASVLQEVKATTDDADTSGYMQAWENKRWKRMWFVLKEKCLYYYRASEDTAAVKSIALIGFQVQTLKTAFQKVDPDLLFEVTHKNVSPTVFKTDNKVTRDRWLKYMAKAVIP